MVSTRVVAPATWTEVARNLVPSPFGTEAPAGYGGLSSLELLTGGLTIAPFAASPVPDHPQTGLRLRIPAGAPTGGGVLLATGLGEGTYTVSMWVNRLTDPASTFGFALRGFRAIGASRTFPFNTWTYLEETFTVTAGEAAGAGAPLGWRNTVTGAIQSEFYLINMQVTPVGQSAPQGALVVSGAAPSPNPQIRYRWLGTPEASTSVAEAMSTPEITEPVFEVVKLISPTDMIEFRAEPGATGFVYDNETLQRWYNLPSSDPDVNKRPNAHGAFGLGKVYVNEHRPLISGQYFGATSAAAKKARRRLSAMFNDGEEITMSVTDEEGFTESRTVNVVELDAPFLYDFSYFDFDIELIATDPRRYSPGSSSSTGMPTAGSGLLWPLGPGAPYFDWGTAGNPGIVSFANTGEATTYPRLEIGGPGSLPGGFRIVEVETGREVTYARTVTTGQVVVLDSRTQRAYIGQGDVTGLLTSRQWFEIPRGQTRRYQIVPLGTPTGAPIMSIYTASANL